jgi:hypothetical protein
MATFRQGQIDDILNYDRGMNRIILDRLVAQVTQFNDEKAHPTNRDIKFEALLGQLVDKLKATIAEALQSLTSKQYPSINLVNFDRLVTGEDGDDGIEAAPEGYQQKKENKGVDKQLQTLKKKNVVGDDEYEEDSEGETSGEESPRDEGEDETFDYGHGDEGQVNLYGFGRSSKNSKLTLSESGRPHLGIGRHFLKAKPKKVGGQGEGMADATGAKSEGQFTKSVENYVYDIVGQYNGIVGKLLEATQQDGLYKNSRSASASMVQTYANILKGLIEPLRHFLSEASLVRNPQIASLFNMIASMIELIDYSPPFQKVNIEGFRNPPPDYQGLTKSIVAGNWNEMIAIYDKFLGKINYDIEKMKKDNVYIRSTIKYQSPENQKITLKNHKDKYDTAVELKGIVEQKLKDAKEHQKAGLPFMVGQYDAELAKKLKEVSEEAGNYKLNIREVEKITGRTRGEKKLQFGDSTGKDKIQREELLKHLKETIDLMKPKIDLLKKKQANPDEVFDDEHQAEVDALTQLSADIGKKVNGLLRQFDYYGTKKYSGSLGDMKGKLDKYLAMLEDLASGKFKKPVDTGAQTEGDEEGEEEDAGGEEEEEEGDEEEEEEGGEEEEEEEAVGEGEGRRRRKVGRGDGKPDLKAKMDDIASAKDQEERTYKYAHLRGREEGKAKAAMARTMKLLGSGPAEDAAMAAKQAAMAAREQAVRQQAMVAAREQARQAAEAARQAAMPQGQSAAGKPRRKVGRGDGKPLADYLGSKKQVQYNSMGRPISNDDEIHNKEANLIKKFQNNVPIHTTPVGSLYPFYPKAPESKYDFINQLRYDNDETHPTQDARGADISLLQGPIGGPTTEKQLPMKKNKSQRVVRTPQEALQAVLNGGAKNGALKKIVFDDEANDMFDEDSGAQNGFIPEDKDDKFKFPEVKKKGAPVTKRR